MWYLGGLEDHLLDVFVRHAEELLQRLVLGRIILPQIASPTLARKDPAEQHNLDHVDELYFLVRHVLDASLESGQLYRRTPGQALLFPGDEPRGDFRSKFGGRHPVGVMRLGDVEPSRLPPLYGLHEGAFEP